MFFFILSSYLFVTSAYADDKQKRIIVGYIEFTKVEALDFEIKAKLDTGAKTSSIHAKIIEIKKVEKKDDSIVFSILTEKGKSKNFHKKIKRWTKIKTKKGGFVRRPVVEMSFCIAGQYITGEVNLADREKYIYDALIGRNSLIKGHLVVDPSKKFTTQANCASVESQPKLK